MLAIVNSETHAHTPELKWFDSVVVLTASQWKSEPKRECYQYARRFAGMLPVLLVQCSAIRTTPEVVSGRVPGLEVESTDLPNIDLVQIACPIEEKQAGAIVALLRSRGLKRTLLWIDGPANCQNLIEFLPNAFRVFQAEMNYIAPEAADDPQVPNAVRVSRRLLSQIDLLVGSSEAVIRSYEQTGAYRGPVLFTQSDSDRGAFFALLCRRIVEHLECVRARQRRLNILVLYDQSSDQISTVYEHLNAFRKYLPHKVYFVGATIYSSPIPENFDFALFDVIIVHYSVRLAMPEIIQPPVSEKLARFGGLKMLLIQDEYDATETASSGMEKLRFDVVYTCVPEDGRQFVYPKRRFPATEFLPTLTGYVPDDPFIDNCAIPLAQRDIVIGYRGRILPYHYGKLAHEKYQIGVEVARLAQERGIRVDIEVDDEKRIYGIDWYRFLGSIRATLGSESGSNVFDFDGKLKESVAAARTENPDLTFDDIHRRLLDEHDGLVKMNQVSPKIFEAIRLRTALVLFEGTYSGVVKPNVHYIPLKKDFSNIDEVFQKLEDLDYLQKLTEQAYDDIIRGGKYSYRQFIKGIEADIAARTWRGPRYMMFVSPVHARDSSGDVSDQPEPSVVSAQEIVPPQAVIPILQQRVARRFPRLYAVGRLCYMATQHVHAKILKVCMIKRLGNGAQVRGGCQFCQTR